MKPELIVFSQNLLGGGASFHKNMLAHFPTDFFDIRCIYLDPVNGEGAKALDIKLNPNDVIFPYGNETIVESARKLSRLIANRPGVVVANLENELISLDLFRNQHKTIYFICHDNGFLPLAVKYQAIIDVFIAHNKTVFQDLGRLLEKREKDIHFIQHGVNIQDFQKQANAAGAIKIVFLARHYTAKGIYDLPLIDELLQRKQVAVQWTILGDGPERKPFMQIVESRSNFTFCIPASGSEVLEILKGQDIFILPSRNDGLPVALLESMSVGCVPVLANFSEGIKEVVDEEIGFVLPVGDNGHFADAIAGLANDRALLAKLSKNCIQKIKLEFDIKKQALKYYQLYERFQELRKRHPKGWKDLIRIGGYYENMSKLIHIAQRLTSK